MKRRHLVFLCILGCVCTLVFYYVLSVIIHQPVRSLPTRWIAQTGPVKEGLKTECLAEIIGLASDTSQQISPELAAERLARHPTIKEVTVENFNSETLYIDYTLRSPIFYLGSVTNTVVDAEGMVFPLAPFFTPKRLPRLYLGNAAVEWGERLDDAAFSVALELLQLLQDTYRVVSIDVSNWGVKSLGKKELVVVLKGEQHVRHYLRLTPQHFQQELINYGKIRREFSATSMVFDFRLSQQLFMTPLKDG